jgi:hypothetical protein
MNDSTSKPEWDLNTFVWVNEKKLPGFGRLLESWLNVHRKYCAGISPELPWEYTERPQIGLLSNAAVLVGGIALEEWSTEKMSDQGKKGYGRNDLWLRLCPPSNRKDYQIEAKHARLDLRNSVSDSDQTITQTMSEACRESERSNPKNGKIVAVSFLSLRFAQKNTESLENKTHELCLHIQDQNRHKNDLDAIAAIWLGAEDFERSREEREQIAKDWTNDEVGIIFLASRIN